MCFDMVTCDLKSLRFLGRQPWTQMASKIFRYKYAIDTINSQWYKYGLMVNCLVPWLPSAPPYSYFSQRWKKSGVVYTHTVASTAVIKVGAGQPGHEATNPHSSFFSFSVVDVQAPITGPEGNRNGWGSCAVYNML